MNTSNRVCALLGIDFPIIQAGMVWCSGWELASAVSNAGGLGILGAGSMYPQVLRDHITKVQAAAPGKPFAVNVPLLYPAVEEHMQSIVDLGVPVVFTSAGNPNTWTSHLKSHGVKVIHVVSSVKFALKAEQAGVDAVVAEGFEAGGHNGREETTTMCLVPAVADACKVPVIAAGGLHDGRSVLAAMMLGAEAAQIGSRFVATPESSAHLAFKEAVVAAGEGATSLELKSVTPVRLLHNDFAKEVIAAQQAGATVEALRELLGRGRAKKGMFEGDLVAGELEIGQVAAMLTSIEPAADVVGRIVAECRSLGGPSLGGRFSF
ncbi:MAG: nitronate monooxygenase [Bacteroidetes bacterium]|nr:nitronate monooxygenase [Bacteroidota bacterium]MDA0903854.1 nitronate monooxygenase [Bacteroidota bacterium]MDA1242852.1 nitronate monooxygenase [Bacteroidota bacterium]